MAAIDAAIDTVADLIERVQVSGDEVLAPTWRPDSPRRQRRRLRTWNYEFGLTDLLNVAPMTQLTFDVFVDRNTP